MTKIKEVEHSLPSLIKEQLKPFTKKIDSGDYYAKSYLKGLGSSGFFSSPQKLKNEILASGMELIEETAKTCMTTAFCLWCHFAALTYVRNSENEYLKNKLLPSLEKGEILGATGLSNPMKYYAGLEKLHLKATQVPGGYILSGVLPAVSNLDHDHWFGVIASVSEDKQIMFFVPCNVEGLTLKEKKDFLGVNGSATYTCTFQDVFIPNDWVIAEDASKFCEKIRPEFIIYQIPLGLGVIHASIQSIESVSKRQNGCNRYLRKQAEDLKVREKEIREKLKQILNEDEIHFKKVAKIRLKTAYLTLEAVQTSMLHNGSSGYLKDSLPARRLREGYFFANLTPTIKHLEKVLHDK